MEILFILAAIVLFAPIVISILKSLNLLGTKAGAYYDFGVVFRNTKPWTVILYIAIVAVLGLVVLFLAGVPLARLPA